MNYDAATLLDPPRQDDQYMMTSSDLLAMRILLGLAREEAGTLLGIGPGEVRDLERARTHFVFAEHERLLTEMLDRVNDLLDAEMEKGAAPDFLFSFPNDPVFQEYEPELADWMRWASVHRMYIARLLDAHMQNDHRPTIVEIVPAQYQEFLRGRPDSSEEREAWARAHVKVLKVLPGLPGRSERARQ